MLQVGSDGHLPAHGGHRVHQAIGSPVPAGLHALAPQQRGGSPLAAPPGDFLPLRPLPAATLRRFPGPAPHLPQVPQFWHERQDAPHMVAHKTTCIVSKYVCILYGSVALNAVEGCICHALCHCLAYSSPTRISLLGI